jgi:hypothetical protein
VPRYDYTTVGHVTRDVLDTDEAPRPGGTAFYSALQAARLDLRTLILTKGDPHEIELLLGPYRDELDLTVLPAEHTTTLLTSCEGPERHQRLRAWAGPIEAPEVDTAILHLAPVARETPRAWRGHAGFVGLTPQGLVREWDAAGTIALGGLRRERLPERCEAWVLSERERDSCAASLERAVAEGAVVAVTAGALPTALHLPDGRRLHVPVPPVARVCEDLGAGDVFAAALFVALREGQPPVAATAFAHAAAAVRIAGAGPGAIGDRRAIEARLSSVPRAPRRSGA